MTIQVQKSQETEILTGTHSPPVVSTTTPSAVPGGTLVAPGAPFQMSSVGETAITGETQGTGKALQGSALPGKTVLVLITEWVLACVLMYFGMQWCKQNIAGFTGGPGVASIVVMGALGGLAFPSAKAVVEVARRWKGARATGD